MLNWAKSLQKLMKCWLSWLGQEYLTEESRHIKSSGKLTMAHFLNNKGIIYIHWISSGQTSQQRLLCGGFQVVLEEISWRMARATMHQHNAPVQNLIPLTLTSWQRSTSKLSLVFPRVYALIPGTFGCSLTKGEEGDWDKGPGHFLFGRPPWSFTKWLECYKGIEMKGSYFEGD